MNGNVQKMRLRVFRAAFGWLRGGIEVVLDVSTDRGQSDATRTRGTSPMPKTTCTVRSRRLLFDIIMQLLL